MNLLIKLFLWLRLFLLFLSKVVSDKLQSEDLDVVSGCERVTDLLTAVKDLRCDVKFEQFWVATLEKCAKLGIKEPKEKRPRRLDENPDSAVQVSVKDNFKVFFYYNVSFQTIHYIVTNVLVTVSFTMVLSLYFRYWTL